LKRLEFVEAQEDIWYECVDRRKWSTFDTVCLKKYLQIKEGPVELAVTELPLRRE